MENDFIKCNFSKSKTRKYSQSLHKLFGITENIFDEEKPDNKNIELDEKKPISLEKLNFSININEEKEENKSKRKKTEGPPAAIKTFCRIRPTDNKNGNFLFFS